MFKRCCLLLLMLLLGIQFAAAQDGFTDTGTIDDDNPEEEFELFMAEGDTVTIAVTAISGDLDTTVTLYDSSGEEVAFNDDIDTAGGDYDSQLVYTALFEDDYLIVVSSYDETTSGDFEITVTFVDVISFEGEITEDENEVTFEIDLEANQTVAITATSLDGDLDTMLLLLDPDGGQVANNDDIDPASGNYNSQIVYEPSESGTYTIVVTPYEGTGEFIVTVAFDVDLSSMASGGRPNLDGAELTRETEHFVIHYTLDGDNGTTERFVDQAAEQVELVWDMEIEQMGWPAPPSDNGGGGDDRYDVYIIALCDEEGDNTAYGYAQPDGLLVDNPNTEAEEEFASASFLTVDNNFDDDCFSGGTGDLLTTLAHEFHHAIQFGYDANELTSWYFESTATWMETQVAGEDEAATIYVADYFQYPELCFGSPDTMYGNYLFIQSLVDAHGEEIVQRLWENIAQSDGMQPLEDTLAEYDDTVENAIARYGMQNLVRDYPLAERFDATVWLENTIDDAGTWTFTGNGIQELATNYFFVDLDEGSYNAELDGRDAGHMELWAIGIDGDTAESFALGNGATFSTEGYDYVYLMILNTNYDDNPEDCSFETRYEIRVSESNGDLPEVVETWDASDFEPLDD
jgi:hypothetical protein